ncbi:cutinase family protein [Nocardia puris]|uniref:cutinase family protein n=1 Tax=Nocardia puris TaxID=208602 RepID=UPI001E345D7A|nr:cutinase family protein [Nocardia puris]
MMATTRAGRGVHIAAVTATACLSAAASAGIGAPSASSVPIGPGCPALYVLGVQGTGQSSPNADPLADIGVMGALIGPAVTAVPHLMQRSYIAYGAGFGGIVPGGAADPYVVTVTDARRKLDAAVVEISATCPSTMIAAAGHSQGAQAVSGFARDVGAGAGPVSADKIAGIALYSNPDRAPGASVLAGRPGQLTPDPAPGTSGAAVAGVRIANPAAAGGGIAGVADYGALTGRVADICTDGDLACSAPERAALLRFGAIIGAQADLTNPVAALTSINAGLSGAFGRAWNTIVANDFHVGPAVVDYAPTATLAQRLIESADPRTTATDPGVAAARWGHITATIAANPLELGKLVGQLAAAWSVFAADNADLVNPLVWARYLDTVARHNNYAAHGQLDSGIAWLIALATDASGAGR